MKFSRIKVDGDGEYAVTLYYMLPEEERRAYIQVGDDGDKVYYDFHTRDDYDRSKGLTMGMKTIYVQLKEGTNILYYGQEDGTAPDLDKITVAPTQETQDIIDGIRQPELAGTTVGQALRLLHLRGRYALPLRPERPSAAAHTRPGWRGKSKTSPPKGDWRGCHYQP